MFLGGDTNARFRKAIEYQYTATFICGDLGGGFTTDPNEYERDGINQGIYRTAIHIHNPNDNRVEIRKKIALTFPTTLAGDNEDQIPGPVSHWVSDELPGNGALEVDCGQIPEGFEFNGGQDTCTACTPLVKGFVVIRSYRPLDVQALYIVRIDGVVDASGDGGGMNMVVIPERRIIKGRAQRDLDD
jgi:hypothetical protein